MASVQTEELRALTDAVRKGTRKLRGDAPTCRRTASTFDTTATIDDWALRGGIAEAIRTYNEGGQYRGGVFTHRDFFLARIFDAMEELGRDRFEKFVPNVWDTLITLYTDTFFLRIVPTIPSQEPQFTTEMVLKEPFESNA